MLEEKVSVGASVSGGEGLLEECDIVRMEPSTAALVHEAASTNESSEGVTMESTNASAGEAAPIIHYPRSATIFAAVASIIFIIVGIMGESDPPGVSWGVYT